MKYCCLIWVWSTIWLVVRTRIPRLPYFSSFEGEERNWPCFWLSSTGYGFDWKNCPIVYHIFLFNQQVSLFIIIFPVQQICYILRGPHSQIFTHIIPATVSNICLRVNCSVWPAKKWGQWIGDCNHWDILSMFIKCSHLNISVFMIIEKSVLLQFRLFIHGVNFPNMFFNYSSQVGFS